ncbi:MAG: zf-TFIIB domain-containing protein [Acidobacteriota bacterium]|nr:zf-TFIIB domain-containing protein [Acidobacteriota bacterium]
MKIESLNCPNCGAAVSSDSSQCVFCHSRLKTQACPACFGLMFLGSRHCQHCGAKTIKPEFLGDENPRECPRCRSEMKVLQFDETVLRECEKCGGFWADADSFERICASRERQAVVLSQQFAVSSNLPKDNSIRYMPCPECGQLMNRNNFARSSGVIIDTCKRHGIWFDAEELPGIVEFIRKGGLERAREKEKLQLEQERNRLRERQFQAAIEGNRFQDITNDSNTVVGIREFISLLFD